MNTVLKGVVGVFGAGLVAAGLAAMLAPGMLAATFAVDSHAVIGLSTLRGMVGGLFVGLGAMMLLGLITAEAGWFRTTALLFGAVAFGRLLGFAFDGPTPDSLLPFGVEVTGMSLMLAAARRLRAASAA
jgi:hypothetical protein